MATVVRVKGSGGVVFDMDIPPEDSFARERYEEQLRNGDLVLLGDDGEPIPAPPEPPNMASEAGDAPPDPKVPEGPAANASKIAWAAYAETLGLAVTPEMSRDDIKAGVEAFLEVPPVVVEPPADPPAV